MTAQRPEAVPPPDRRATPKSGDRRDEITVRFQDRHRLEMEEAAADEGLALSTWIRVVAVRAAREGAATATVTVDV